MYALRRPSVVLAYAAPAAALCALLTLPLVAGWSGSDLPAHVFRTTLFARHGLAIWNDQWYGGHYLPSYSLLAPVLGALVGVRVLAVFACFGATVFVSLLTNARAEGAGRAATVAFALAMVPEVIIGRVAFDLGLALALASLWAFVTGRRTLAVALALTTPLASPLAALFLAFGCGVKALVERSRPAAAVAACALVPTLLLAAAFPEGGAEPFGAGLFVFAALTAGSVALLHRRGQRAVYLGAGAYLAGCAVSFVLPTPVGGNAARLAMSCGPALIAVGGWRRARTLAVITASLALVWQWVPAITTIARGSGDASRQASYFAPLIRYVETRSEPGRVEIPFTRSHWEAAFVAPRLPLARGWERQLDIRYNGLFYQGRLSPAAYHAWLRRMAVRYVALPDVPLDPAGQGEAALLRHAPAYLTPVFRSPHWTVWRVDDALPLAGGGVHVHRLGPDSVTLSTARPANTLLRVHFTRLWTFGDSGGCASAGRAGWTRVRLPRAGVYTLHVSDSVLRLLGIGSGCAPS